VTKTIETPKQSFEELFWLEYGLDRNSGSIRWNRSVCRYSLYAWCFR